MDSRRYNISMQTPIGKKYGTLTVSKDDGVLTGELGVMNHSEPFHGTIDSDGVCHIEGTIVTLLRTVNYTATGSINEDGVRLFVVAANHTFEVTGEATA